MRWLAMLLLSGCAAQASTSEPPSRPAPTPAPSASATVSPRSSAAHDRLMAAAAELRQQHADPGASCDDGRANRVDEMKKRLASIAQRGALDEWRGEHCKLVDRSKAVVRVGQDHTGEFHAYEGRDRGVDLECDAKLPAELQSVPVDVYAIPAATFRSIRDCRDADLADASSAETTRAYWTQTCHEWSHNGKRGPAFCKAFAPLSP